MADSPVSRLAQYGIRYGILGSASSLAVAFPLGANQMGQQAHTDGNRIGWFADRTVGAESITTSVMGTQYLTVGRLASAGRVLVQNGYLEVQQEGIRSAMLGSPYALNITGASGGYAEVDLFASSNSAVHAAAFYAYRSRGTSAAPIAVINGDRLFVWGAAGFDGTGVTYDGEASIRVDGSVSAGNCPIEYIWQNAFYSTRMRLRNAGQLELLANLSATSSTTGTLRVTGGAGLTDSLYCNGGTVSARDGTSDYARLRADGGGGWVEFGNSSSVMSAGCRQGGGRFDLYDGTGTGTILADFSNVGNGRNFRLRCGFGVNESTITTTGVITALNSDTTYTRLTGAAPDIQGVDYPTGGYARGSRLLMLYCVNQTVFRNENAGATAGNRIVTLTGADITVSAGRVVSLVYDVTSTRWRLYSVNAMTGSGTNNVLPRWSGTTALVDSGVSDDGTAVTISRSAASTSSATGGLILTGGLGVAGSLFANGGTISARDAASEHSRLRADSSGGWVQSAKGSTIWSIGQRQTTGQLDFAVGALDSSPTVWMRITSTSLVSGRLDISATTDSTSSTSGSITTAGGVGIAKQLYVTGPNIQVGSGSDLVRMRATGGGGNFTVVSGGMDWCVAPGGGGQPLNIGRGTDGVGTIRLSLSDSAHSTTRGVRAHYTIDSVSPVTGALISDGGLGVTGSMVGGGGLGTRIQTLAADTTLTATSAVIRYNGTGNTLTLPAANAYTSTSAQLIVIRHDGTGTLTVQRAGADTIEGATSVNLTAAQSLVLCSDGVSRWLRVVG